MLEIELGITIGTDPKEGTETILSGGYHDTANYDSLAPTRKRVLKHSQANEPPN